MSVIIPAALVHLYAVFLATGGRAESPIPFFQILIAVVGR
jgi:hypothetical protein